MFRTFIAAAGMALALVTQASATPPLEAYAQLPAIDDVEISPDGTKLAYVRNEGDTRQLIVQSRADGVVLGGADLSSLKLRELEWGSPNHVIIIASTTVSPAEGYFLKSEVPVAYSFNVNTGAMERFMNRSSKEALNALLSWPKYGVYKGKPVAYAVGYTLEPYRKRDIYRIDLDTGYGNAHYPAPDFLSEFLTTQDGEIAALSTETTTGIWKLQVRGPNGIINAAKTPKSIDTPEIVGFGRTTDKVLLRMQDEDTHEWVLREIDRATGEVGQPFGQEGFDSFIFAPDGSLAGIASTDILPSYVFYDPQLNASWELVSKAFKGKRVELDSWTSDFKTVVVRVDGTGEPGAWYVIDTPTKKAQRVGSEYPGVNGTDVADVRLFNYKAADGLDIHGFLTLPPGKDPKNLPLVVMPHGGPAAKDVAGFDWWAQAMASRGYAVFQPNFRGSAGLGQRFLEAGYGEYGRKMQTDLSDGVRALTKAGYVDPQRVCIVGASYGGYAALAGMTLDTGVYRCAVSYAGTSDLPRKQERLTARTGDEDNTASRYWNRYLGVEDGNDPLLKQLSPAYHADRVQGPILLIHGKDDTIVAYEQSVAMAKALDRAGKPYEFVTLAKEDHNLSRASTRLQMLTSLVAFLEKNNPPN